MLEDAELLLGLWRHLSAFQVNQARAALGELEYAGKVYEIAWRLRNSGVSSAERVRAIGVEAKLTRLELERLILPTLDQLGWVKLNCDADRALVSVDAVIPPPAELVPAAGKVLAIVVPSPPQLAALQILRATSRQPLERSAAIDVAAEHGEQAAEEALRHLTTLRLVRQVQAADGRSAVFNPNIWAGDAEVAQAALRVEDARVRTEVGGLIEEVAASPGMPEVHVKSTEQRWVDFAVSQGLVQRSVVQTTEGAERRFLFTAHLTRDAFGNTSADASGHIRQLVGSMVYAATFARFQLYSPAMFIRRLVRDGEAGDASPIGTDYPMLETAGIVRVVPGSSTDKYRLQLLQSDVAEGAIEILRGREDGSGDSSASGSAEIRGQRSYTHVERERARLAHGFPVDNAETKRLLAALRQVTRGSYVVPDGKPDRDWSVGALPRRYAKGGARMTSGGKQRATPGDDGTNLERRVARVEFAEGALARLRVPVRVDAETGRDVLTDLDVLAIDVDLRLRCTRSVLECKSGQGQAKEPDRLFWLEGLARYVGADRAALVRRTTTSRGRSIAAALGLQILDVPQIEAREAAHAWLPPTFAHISGEACIAAEARTDTQIKALGNSQAELVAFLRHDALLAPSDRVLASLVALSDWTGRETSVPEPAGTVLAAHALMALLMAAISDAHSLDVLRPDEMLGRLERFLTVGNNDDEKVLEVLEIADQLIRRFVEQVHERYAAQGATRAELEVPSLRRSVSDPPGWLPRYMDLLEALRANPAVARDLLQTAELACFEALMGASAHLSPAFDHLFTPEHRQLLRVAVRTLRAAVGPLLADRLGSGFAEIDFERIAPVLPDRRAARGAANSEPVSLADEGADGVGGVSPNRQVSES